MKRISRISVFIYLQSIFFSLSIASCPNCTTLDPIEEECMNCTQRGCGFRFFKCIAQISPQEYLCLNDSKHLPHGSQVVEIIRNEDDCQDVHIRLPSRVLTDFKDFKNPYSLIDDIFLIVGNNSTRDRTFHDQEAWFFIPLMCK